MFLPLVPEFDDLVLGDEIPYLFFSTGTISHYGSLFALYRERPAEVYSSRPSRRRRGGGCHCSTDCLHVCLGVHGFEANVAARGSMGQESSCCSAAATDDDSAVRSGGSKSEFKKVCVLQLQT